MTRPIARHIACNEDGPNASPSAASSRIWAGKDSADSSSVHYVTAARLERIGAELTERDWEVTRFVADHRLATSKQLIRLFWTADPLAEPARARAGSRALKRLSDWWVLDPLPGRARGGVRGGSATMIYCLGVAGRRLLARRGLRLRRMGAPGERYITHTLACTGLAVDLQVANRQGELELIEVQSEPVCHRYFLGPWGARWAVKPDLFIRIGAGALEDRWFVEVDLGSEHAGTLLTKAKRYLAHYRSGAEQREHGVYPRVLWAVPDLRRAQELHRVLRRLPGEAEPLFVICQLDEVPSLLAAEARA